MTDVLTGHNARYTTQHDAEMRLARSVVLLKGQPAFVQGVSGLNLILALPDGTEPIVNVNSVDLDISSVPLGYINTGRGPYYLQRGPNRSQKQGVVLSRMNWFSPYVKEFCPPPFNDYEAFGYWVKTFNRDFPTMEECLKHPKGGAFHRFWAVVPVNKDLCSIGYKDKNYALFNKDKRLFILPKGEGNGVVLNRLHYVMGKQGGLPNYDVVSL